MVTKKLVWVLLGLLAVLPGHANAQRAANPSLRPVSPPHLFEVELVAATAFGYAQNDLGDVVGTSWPDPGCGSTCAPAHETVVWRGGQRIVLPVPPGFTTVNAFDINNQGWIIGTASNLFPPNRALLWRPNGGSYALTDLGSLPGHSSANTVGIDELGRVVGWSTTTSSPPSGTPFMWTQAGGMIDLAAQGFPSEPPMALSPGGTVATQNFWYRLGDPGSVRALPTPPPGFLNFGYPAVINDAGDQARYLIDTHSLLYPFRFHSGGTGSWQQISSIPTGSRRPYGLGSINDDLDILATVSGNGYIAYGPDGEVEPLSPLVAPSYHIVGAFTGGPMNSNGEILTSAMVGRSQRLVRLKPAPGCVGGCIEVSEITMDAVFVPDPNENPEYCLGNAHNEALVILTVTRRNGLPVAGVQVSGRLLDDYWMEQSFSGTTNANGEVSFVHIGPCAVGALAFFVDGATHTSLTLDRTVGHLTVWQIPPRN